MNIDVIKIVRLGLNTKKIGLLVESEVAGFSQ